ncbi:MAG: fibrobacter succinogenes major paralogous domain-containing protein [Bacteroidota bacterium]
MKPKITISNNGAGLYLFPVALLVLLFTFALYSCQQEEVAADDDLMLKKAVTAEITLTYPIEEVEAGEEFDIVFSANCGKIMLERAYINGDPIEEGGEVIGYEKVYAGLTCETEGLLWEAVGDDDFLSSCEGGTETQNLTVAGTYVYRVKLNQTAYKKSDCPNCGSFKGNLFECFIVTVTDANQGTFVDDRDGKQYKWIKIGDQVWMAENLAYLPAISPTSQGSAITPCYYVYDYQGTDLTEAKQHPNYKTYGVLYNWPAAMASCPEGWHLPSDDEWATLIDFLGGIIYAGSEMKSVTGWNSPNSGATNSSGFSALPGGNRDYFGSFYSVGYIGSWWSSMEGGSHNAWYRSLGYSNATVYRHLNPKESGFSVRCVRD